MLVFYSSNVSLWNELSGAVHFLSSDVAPFQRDLRTFPFLPFQVVFFVTGTLKVLVVYDVKAFSFERDLWGCSFSAVVLTFYTDLCGCSFSIILELLLLNGISGVLVFYRSKTFPFERDLWGCSFSIIPKLFVWNGISGDAGFLSLESFVFRSGCVEMIVPIVSKSPL